MQYSEPTLIPVATRNPERMLAVTDPRRVLNGIYAVRLLVASANFAWAVLFALFASPLNTVIAATAFVVAMGLTAVSYIRTEINRRHAGPGFLYLQFVHDLLLVTVVVQLTGGGDSQFAALYILVNATAALLLPIGSSLLLALLGSVLYTGDAFWVSGGEISIALLLQLVVFVLVVVGTSLIAGQLQQAGQGREQLEAELASAQLRAADILANIQAGIITVDDIGRLLYANPAAARLLGIPLEALTGQPVLPQLAAVAPSVAAAVQATIAGQISARREGRVRRDGRDVPISITTTAVLGDLRPVGGATTVIVQDIADEKRLEALRLRAQRLEAVAELSASLAHEIRNPLASIRSSVEQLSRRAAATADERTLGELITRESDRLSRLLSEFLDFARVQAARRDPLDLRDVVRSAVALAGTHPDRGIDVHFALEMPATPATLYGDEDLLHRTVFNLVLNALQASGDRGKVAVSVRRVSGREQATGLSVPGASWAIEVQDDGPGIPVDIQDRLFEPFATTKPGGSGLGLAVVHRAVEAHRGVILVDGDSTGTRFTVYLPTEDESSGAAS